MRVRVRVRVERVRHSDHSVYDETLLFALIRTCGPTISRPMYGRGWTGTMLLLFPAKCRGSNLMDQTGGLCLLAGIACASGLRVKCKVGGKVKVKVNEC